MSFLRRSALTAALVGSLALGSFAQTTTPTASAPAPPTTPLLGPGQVTTEKYKDYLNKRYADDKEARAVIHLFNRKKTGGIIWLATGVGVIGFVASQTGTKTTNSGTTTVTVTPLGYGLMLGLFGGVGIGKLARFNSEKLYQTLAEYDKSHSFPGFVMEKLDDKDYR
ncbi:hypothetical protein [Hymenobacter cellulosilyticus]|uniref:Uncharacterized protein n=1 Tax=Hymenobacter cellulosilyticus TaxID=2932248 RepID=A0A8T9Q1X3_9BACT|nr:hypothetical protein [Hymenobacter cellulosilyticus]UOQ71504.1 hypothetical protein MUN79_23265 [Hymenobacter cellulosilyticus]